jgi:hypothetical protein
MLLKMLGIHRIWQLDEAGPKPRQVFITQSQVLVEKVEEYFLKLASAFGVDIHPPEEMRTTDEETTQVTGLPESEDELIGQEYQERWRLGLPKRFTELSDGHFPLFITYDQVRLLQYSKA